MSDLISRQETISKIQDLDMWCLEDKYGNYCGLGLRLDDALKLLKEMSSAEKTGHWILVENPNYSPFDGSSENIMICSVCGYKQEQHDFNSCPNCGAKMTEDNDGGL